MYAEMELLLRLQEVDRELHRLQKESALADPTLQQLKKDREKRASILARMDAEMKSTAERRRSFESDLKTREEQLKHFRSRQSMVKTAKEATALEHEITSTEAQVSQLEEQILTLLEQEEKGGAELTEKRSIAANMDKKAADQESRLRGSFKDSEELMKGLREDRIVLANRVDPDVLSNYEWALHRYGPTAAVLLKGDACGGCGGIVVPHLAVQVRQATELVQCTHCRRFLYTPSVAG